jgi:hypothetical protein
VGARAPLANPDEPQGVDHRRELGGAHDPVEFGFGRYVAGDSWATLLHAYNLADGRVWAAVPLFTVVGPEGIRRLHSRL